MLFPIYCGPYPLSAGLAVYLLGLFTFAGLTAQANVNKPSKPRIGPANWHRLYGPRTSRTQEDQGNHGHPIGAAWWFLDQYKGIENQLNSLSSLGLLSRFVGMLTDSRSFLSYPRHEYFRRILCNIIGNEIERGLLPASEFSFINQMVEDICYYNAKRYFGW